MSLYINLHIGIFIILTVANCCYTATVVSLASSLRLRMYNSTLHCLIISSFFRFEFLVIIVYFTSTSFIFSDECTLLSLRSRSSSIYDSLPLQGTTDVVNMSIADSQYFRVFGPSKTFIYPTAVILVNENATFSFGLLEFLMMNIASL